jgi:hypothetical protein
MKLDETLESVGRLWGQISVIVVLHAIFFALALVAGVIPTSDLAHPESLVQLKKLEGYRTDYLEPIGLDLPLVAGLLLVIYVVMFQRLSHVIGQLPFVRLRFSQPGLWRAAKCFDELRQLIHSLEGHTASASLEDLEVTLGVVVARFQKDFPEHYDELVKGHLTTTGLWLQYYGGLWLMAICSLGLVAVPHSFPRFLILPGGLLFAAMIARCGWEAQVEHAVRGRLRFALNCTLIFNEAQAWKWKEHLEAHGGRAIGSEPLITKNLEDIPSADFDNLIWGNGLWTNEIAISGMEPVRFAPLRVSRLLIKDLELATNLMMLPPPCLPYQKGWMLFYVRLFWPFKSVGALPLARNEEFRTWLVHMIKPRMWILREGDTQAASQMERTVDSFKLSLDAYRNSIEWPKPAQDKRLIARWLWWSSRIYPGWLLADSRDRYRSMGAMRTGSRMEVDDGDPVHVEPDPSGGQSFSAWKADRAQ